jgi:hypothetical protein
MYKTLLALFTIYISLSAASANKNFMDKREMLINQHNLQHGEDYMFIKSFLNGTQLFHNLNRSSECMTVLPVIHDDFVDIFELLNHIKSESDFFKIIRGVIDKLEHTFEKLKAVEEPCNDMFTDVARRINKLSHYLGNEWFQKVIFHSITHVDDIRQRYVTFRDLFMKQDYCGSGYALGDLSRFIFFYDFEPELFKLLLLLDK